MTRFRSIQEQIHLLRECGLIIDDAAEHYLRHPGYMILRWTLASIAESLDISAYALKRLLNHSITSDITVGYIVTDVGQLRGPMQQITDYILRVAILLAR